MERTDERTVFTKTFDLGGNRRQLVVRQFPWHYRDDLGAWQECDPTPEDRGGHFVVDRALYSVRVPKDAIAFSYRSRQRGTATSRLIALNGATPRLRIAPVIEGQSIRWVDVVPGLDIVLRFTAGRVEWFKILKSPEAPTSFQWTFEHDSNKAFTVRTRGRGWDAQRSLLDRLRDADLTLETSPEQTIAGGQVRLTVEETFNGRVSDVVDLQTRQKGWTTDLVYPVTIDQDITEDIVANADDVDTRGYPPGWYDFWSTGHSTLRIGNKFGSYGYTAGFRFQSIALPAGATIDDATLIVDVTQITGVPGVQVYAHEIADAPAWADTSGNRPGDASPRTAASTLANPSGAGSYNVDVTAQIQEILDSTAWASGNAMRFMGIVTKTGGSDFFRIYGYESGQAAAQLQINYTEGGAAAVLSPYYANYYSRLVVGTRC